MENIQRPAPLTFTASVWQVFRISALQPLKGRKGVLLTGLALLPIVLMILGRLFGEDRGGGLRFFVIAVVPFYHYINLTFFLFLGCSALGESIEDKTITYDLVCPVRRAAIYLGRFFSFLFSALVILLPVQWVAYTVCMAHFGMNAVTMYFPSFIAMTVTTVAAALVYGAFFMTLSLLLKRAILVGIGLSVIFDGFLAYLPLSVHSMAPLAHFRNLMGHISGERSFWTMVPGFERSTLEIPLSQSIIVLTCLFLVGAVAGGMVFKRKQFY
jgi:ABC-type transport system involved in multi-copper enzyme maturation permease subunit